MGSSAWTRYRVWMESNGDPCVLYDNAEDAMDWFTDMGDAPDSRSDRIATGIDRLRQAIAEVLRRHPEAAQAMDYYTDWAGRAAQLNQE